MPTDNFEIIPYADKYRQQVLTIWEKSVISTHDFLTDADFEEIKQLVASINFYDLKLFCLADQETITGFIGVLDRKIEMLFVDPACFGQGFGLRLLNFAVNELHADRLDVNEQNSKALNLYLKYGFRIYERTDRDDQGRNYPLLRMKLINST